MHTKGSRPTACLPSRFSWGCSCLLSLVEGVLALQAQTLHFGELLFGRQILLQAAHAVILQLERKFAINTNRIHIHTQKKTLPSIQTQSPGARSQWPTATRTDAMPCESIAPRPATRQSPWHWPPPPGRDTTNRCRWPLPLPSSTRRQNAPAVRDTDTARCDGCRTETLCSCSPWSIRQSDWPDRSRDSCTRSTQSR